MLFMVMVFMMVVFLAFRNKEVLCPSNIVFGSYFLYLIFPGTLFYVLEWVEWEYVLPWGKVNDWSRLSDEALLSFAYVFSLFFLFTRSLELALPPASAQELFSTYRVSPLMLGGCRS